MLRLFSTLFCLFLFSHELFAKDFDFDLIQKGNQNNNTLLIVGGIQGDEPGGFIAASLLATHYKVSQGSLWIVPNLNFYSIIKRSRGPFGDMNRKFASLSKKDPDYESVQRIKKFIKDERVKIVVNLHDGSGYYRPFYVDKMHSPYRWGQSSIIDQANIDVPYYGDLQKISNEVVAHVNKYLLKKEDMYHLHNTKTNEGDKEMERTLTYYAINQGKAAFGNEASKSLPTHKRVYYHLVALEKYMQIMGIEFQRMFDLTPKGVYRAINDDIYITLYNEKIKLPLAKIKNALNYFPIDKDKKVEFEASNPLLTIVQKKDTYYIHYGNRRLSKLKADYTSYDNKYTNVALELDGELRFTPFGSIVNVEKSFVVKEIDGYRVNVIGYTNALNLETDVSIEKKQIPKRFSIDKEGNVFRVEYYKDNCFAGMVLIDFS